MSTIADVLGKATEDGQVLGTMHPCGETWDKLLAWDWCSPGHHGHCEVSRWEVSPSVTLSRDLPARQHVCLRLSDL